jgi:glycogen phosphorylase
MKGSGDLERDCSPNAEFASGRDHPFNVGDTTSNNNLTRSIDIGDPQIAVIGATCCCNRFRGGGISADERSHSTRGAPGCSRHGLAPGGHQAQPIEKRERTGRRQRCVFPQGMAGGARWRVRQPLLQAHPQCEGGRIQRRLGMFSPGEFLLRTIEAHGPQRPTENIIGCIAQEIWMGIKEVGAHSDELAALTWKQKCIRHVGTFEAAARECMPRRNSSATVSLPPLMELHNAALPPIRCASGTRVSIPEEFGRLHDLAYNMWWSWDPGARDLWQRISPADWAVSPNPLTVLQTVGDGVWDELLTSDAFRTSYDDVIERCDAYLAASDTWYDQLHPKAFPNGVAYMSAEFGIHETLPFYSGGLGVLAGDHLKAASDLGIPLVGVGLLYRRGYFRQTIDPDGAQQHQYRPIETSRRAVRRVVTESGRPLTVSVDLPGRSVDVAVWRINVGRVPLLLLDTDLASNDPSDRPISHILYVRGREMRLCQEIVLGVGGVRALTALGFDPTTWHVNEGHAAISLLERTAMRVAAGDDLEAARTHVAERSVFTLHTPVPAGNEVFDLDLALRYLTSAFPGFDAASLTALSKSERDDIFDLGALAIRLTRSTNGVSRRHGEVATRDWEPIIGGPADSVTNGVHLPTWVGRSVARRYEHALGSDWADAAMDPDRWADAVRSIPDAELWDAHTAQKQLMLRHLRTRLREQYARHGESPDELRNTSQLLPPHRLTIGFARRFALYKRAGLLLTDLDRLESILTNPDRPVQLVFAGKAHPADTGGKEVIARLWDMAHSPQFEGHVFIVEDYDIGLGRHLVGGADVWLNTPRPPMEASGTSGMKSAANGGLNLSVADGWWLEGASPESGWIFGDNHVSDDADAHALYGLLEDQVVPLFYDLDDRGLPAQWITMMREAMAQIAPAFSARRMVSEYAELLYRSPT